MRYLGNYLSPLVKPKRVDVLSEVTKELDHIFNEVFNGHYFADKKSKGYPLMDAVRQDKSLILQFAVAGVKLEDISVNITEDEQSKLLEISGHLSEEYVSFPENAYQIRELSSKTFRRLIRLPEDATEEEPLAVLRNGILTLTFNTKTQEEQPESKVKNIKIISG